MTQVSPDHVALVTELAQLQSGISRLTERADEIKDMLRELGKGKFDAGVYTLTVSPQRRLSEDKVRAAYPPETHAMFYEQKVKTTAVKALVEPAVYDAMMEEYGKLKISVG